MKNKQIAVAVFAAFVCTVIGAPGVALTGTEEVSINPNLAEDVGASVGGEVPIEPPSDPPTEVCDVRRVNFTKTQTHDRYTRLKMDASAEVRGDSCLMDIVARSFHWEGAGGKSHLIPFNRNTFEQGGNFLFTKSGKSHKWSDDIVISQFWNGLLAASGEPASTSSAAAYENNKKYLDCKTWGNRGSDSQGGRIGGGYWHKHMSNNDPRGQKACFTGSLFVNSACQLIPAADVGEVCGMFNIEYVASTPISLLLDSSLDALKHSVPVDFKLDPSSAAKVWEWRASGKAPLLVYDPEGAGNITSASQLFGNWTFGGRSVASLAGAQDTRWSNGFEALATMDENRDGKVSGQELRSLALWFDENRDGISQKGEVRSLDSVGITALFYASDKVDPTTGDIIASRGFERTVNGRAEVGMMVDWIGVGTDSVFDLAARNQLRGVSELSHLPVQSEPQAPSEHGSAPSEIRAEGLWTWSMDSGEAGQGVFMIFSDENSVIRGQTLTELAFEKASGQPGAPRSAIQFTSLEGTERLTSGNQLAVTFSSGSAGFSQRSDALLSADGRTMTGKTVSKKSDGSTLTYAWTATRLSQ